MIKEKGALTLKLYLKQKVFSWADRFWVYDENGEEKYSVCGKAFSFGKKLTVYDANGSEQAFISEKFLSFLPKYYIYRNGEQIAEVVKEFTFFKPEYSVHGPDWKIKGNFWLHDYEITGENGTVAVISKEWFTWGDAYGIDIADGEDEITVLSATLVIDACIEALNSSAGASSSN